MQTDSEFERAYESDEGVVVRSNTVKFPPFCPACLSPSPAVPVKIRSLDGQSKYRIVYQTYKVRYFEIPFCRSCALKIRLSRIVLTCSIIIMSVAVYLGILSFAPNASGLITVFLFLLVALPLCLIGNFIAKKFGLQWDNGVSMLNSADANFNHFSFTNRTYLDKFLEANR
jgi:hypothetical protein